MGPATTAAFKVSITTGAAGGQTEVHYCAAFKQPAAHSFTVKEKNLDIFIQLKISVGVSWKPERQF